MFEEKWQQELTQAAITLKKLYDAVVHATTGTTKDATELIRIRRASSDHFIVILQIIEKNRSSLNHQRLRQCFSDFRASLAEHQANWPAVVMREHVDAYQDSLRQVEEKLTVFIGECKRG